MNKRTIDDICNQTWPVVITDQEVTMVVQALREALRTIAFYEQETMLADEKKGYELPYG